jgi:dienelactone hydrolase
MKNQRNHARHLLGLALALIGLSGWIASEDHASSQPAPSRSAAIASTSNPGKSEAPAVHALFDLVAPTGGPFPSNRFTVADESHNTGLRINLPLPDCAERTSDCTDLDVINTLDGFNLQPRLSIPFDGPIDVATATSESVFLISLGSTLADEDRDGDDEDRGGGDGDCHDRDRSGSDSERDGEDGDHDGRDGDRSGRIIGINQVVWDPLTNTLHVESDELLNQHTRYALIVTNGLRDLEGRRVKASDAFQRFRQEVRGNYKHALLDAVRAARHVGIRKRNIVAASVFTTQSVTAVFEKMRDQIKAATPVPADFNLGPDGARTVFALDKVSSITWNQQTRVLPPLFTSVQLNPSLLRIFPGVVGQLAFGKYLSPDYRVHPGEFIPPIGTRTGIPVVQGVNDIYFTLVLPSGPAPASGWPVAIFGHGGGGNRHEFSILVAASMAKHGIATIAINVVGHGFGPLGTLTVNQTVGDPVTFSAGGRGIDQNGDGIIGSNEGVRATTPRTIIDNRDGFRQAVPDLMQLVRVIEVGMDVDGDGFGDLDPSRIYCIGQSNGGQYATMFLAIEPDVRVGVPNVTGGAIIELQRLGIAQRPGLGALLAARIPSLINFPGVDNIDGVPVAPPRFNENKPLRNQLPVINAVAGAMAIQEVIDNTEWVSQSGNPVAYAVHIRKDPLPGVPAKSVIIQFAKADQNVNNPTTTALLRAGDLADRATFYRHDLAVAENPALPRNPHAFMTSIANAAFREIALGAQEQIGVFFASDGTIVIHPEPMRFFEVPIVLPLPEEPNFIP